MNCYYGEVHSHTTESDGKGGSPQEAYLYARDVGKADYFAVTDHDHCLNQERFFSMMPPLADRMEQPGNFAALYGYEISYSAADGYYGHANLLSSHSLFPEHLPLRERYDSLAETKENGIGQFNHPGEKWGDFEEFRYDPRLDEVFCLIELRVTEYGIPIIEEEYERCLSKGWHVGPVSNEDTHGGDWTTAREETGAVLAESLSRGTVEEAMRARRTFATTDRSLRLYFRANGAWMGARLAKTGELRVEVEAFTEKECGIGWLQLVGEGNRVLNQIHAGAAKHYRWELSIPDDQRYVYVRRINGMQYAVSAPVWVEQPCVTEVWPELRFCKQGTLLSLHLINRGNEPLERLRVEWYAAPGRVYSGQAPVKQEELKSLAPGGETDAFCLRRANAGENRMLAVLRGVCGGLPFCVTRAIYCAPLFIPRLFSSTKTYTAMRYSRQPYCCFELENRSCEPCDLQEYTFRLYRDSGTAFSDFRIPMILPPNGCLTVWLRGNRELDAEDFNAYYGTALEEGKNLFSVPLELAQRGTVKLLICRGEQTIRRVWIRDGSYMNAVIPYGSAFVYDADASSATAATVSLEPNARPGTVLPRAETVPPKALPAAEDPPRPSPSRVVCFTDGSCSSGFLKRLARERFPESNPLVFVGNRDGAIGLDAYLRTGEGAGLLAEALTSGANAVLLCIGGLDCGRGRQRWLSANFNGFLTVLEQLCLAFRTAGCRVYLEHPEPADANQEELWAMHRTIRAVAETVGAVDCAAPTPLPQAVPSAHGTACKPASPDAKAFRIACVGDQYTENEGGVRPYPSYLQELLGSAYDVRIFAKRFAKAASGDPLFFPEFAKEEIQAAQAFQPDAFILWFGQGDLTISAGNRWDHGYRERFLDGYRELLAMFGEKKAPMLLISPFRRTDADVRMQVLARRGDGMMEELRRLAKERCLPLIDLFRLSAEQPGLIEVDRLCFHYLSDAGSRRLAELVAGWVRSLK